MEELEQRTEEAKDALNEVYGGSREETITALHQLKEHIDVLINEL